MVPNAVSHVGSHVRVVLTIVCPTKQVGDGRGIYKLRT